MREHFERVQKVIGALLDRPALLAAIAIGIAYGGAFTIGPAADDFGPPLTEIEVGSESLSRLLFETRQAKNYRPLQSLVYYGLSLLVGQRSPLDLRLIVAVHFASFLCLWGVCLLGLRAMRALGVLEGRSGGLFVLLFSWHPALVASAASLDGLSSLLATGFVYGGLWVGVALRDRWRRALALNLVLLFVGVLVKEYAYALVVVTPLAIYGSSAQHPLRSALRFFVPLLFFGLFLLMASKMWVPGYKGVGVPVSLQAFTNIGLVLLGVGFVGDSIQVALSASWFWRAAAGLVAVCVLGFVFAAAFGFERDPMIRRRRALLFLLIFASVAPAFLATRISEMYLSAALLAFAALTAESIFPSVSAAFKRRSSLAPARWRISVLIGILALSLGSTWSKVSRMDASARRANWQARLLMDVVPEEARDTTVHVIFRADQPLVPDYSVYQTGDLTGMTATHLFDVYRPKRGLRLSSHVAESPAAVQLLLLELSDPYVLLWDPMTSAFVDARAFVTTYLSRTSV